MSNLIFLALLLELGLLLYLIWHQSKSHPGHDWNELKHRLDQQQQHITSSFHQNTQLLQQQLQQNRHSLDIQLTATQKYLQQTAHQLGQLSQLDNSIKQLQQLLVSPKLRGELGEQLLQDMLSEVIPTHLLTYQYQFASGQIVDAVIRTEDGLIVIDAKFPLTRVKDKSEAQLKQQLKQHMISIARKYIQPEQGTLNFALMYLPSEAVYHHLISQPTLVQLSHKLRVYPVSPSTLYSHLQIILLSFQGQTLQQQTRQLLNTINQLEQHHRQLWQDWQVFHTHWQKANKKLQTVHSKHEQVASDIQQLTRFQSENLQAPDSPSPT